MKYFPSEKWLFWIYYPLVSIGINLIGQGNSLSRLVQIPSFYTDLILAFVLSFLAGYYLRFIWRLPQYHTQANSKYVKERLLWGLLLPFAVCVSVEVIYLVWLLDIPLDKSPVFGLDSPLMVIFILRANLC